MNYRTQKGFALLAVLLTLVVVGCGRIHDEPALVFAPNQVIVHPGETLYGIAHKYNVSPRALISKNSLSAPFYVAPGQILTLPDDPDDETPLASPQEEELPALMDQQVSSDLNENATDSTPKVKISSALTEEIAQEKNQEKQGHTTPPKQPKKKKYDLFPQNEKKASLFTWPAVGPAKEVQDGIRITAKLRSQVKAARSGHVIFAGTGVGTLGKLILIDHGDGTVTTYAYCDKILVKNTSERKMTKKEWVKQGQVIALVGRPKGKGPQLHFEIRKDTVPQKPLEYLPKSVRSH